MADWLMEWQTLVRSAIGGIMALVVALVVSRSGRWREFSSAASHVSLEFGKYCAALAAMRETFPGGVLKGAGETLRDRIDREKQLPVDESVYRAEIAVVHDGSTGRWRQ